MGLYSVVRKIPFLRRAYETGSHIKSKLFVWIPCALIARRRYARQLERVRQKAKTGRVRILFPVGSAIAKWKMQSLYDLFRKMKGYEPVMAISCCDFVANEPIEDKRKNARHWRDVLSRSGMPFVEAYDWQRDRAIPFSEFSPDIVWYQSPWEVPAVQMPVEVSKYALTCYCPYFVQNYGALELDCNLLFHRELWRHFTLNGEWARIFMEKQGRLARAGDTVGIGHPMLDPFYLGMDSSRKPKYVIYAPHWSCGIGECYSTFLKYGVRMLDFAKSHPEIDWVFKPHPSLRHVLVHSLSKNEREVDSYYGEWAKIGQVWQDGDYVELFLNAKALITDCASFLMEFAGTGSPIMHLVSNDAKYKPHPISASLFDSFYKVREWNDFVGLFNRVVVRGDDFKKNDRMANVRGLKLGETYAAAEIVDYIEQMIRGAQ